MGTSTTTAVSPRPRSEPAALTPGVEQEGIRDAVRGILGKHAAIDQVRAASESEVGYSPELWAHLVDDMSVTTLAVPEDRSGLGYGMVEMGIILEECGRSLAPAPVYASAHLGVQALLQAPEAHSGLFGTVLDGSRTAVISTLTDDSDRLEATRPDSEWILNGTARYVVGGAEADIVVVSAEYADGRGVFAVETSAHVDAQPRTVLDPTRRRADLTFHHAPAILLSAGSDSVLYTARLHDLSVLALASENTGITDALLTMTVDYTKTRFQFGRPIGSFQSIKHRLADLLIELERARSAARYAAAVYDENPDDARLAIAVAGAVCTDAAIHAAHEAVQLHGGVGFTWEHSAQSYFRRALGNEAIQGSSRAHRARIADLIEI